MVKKTVKLMRKSRKSIPKIPAAIKTTKSLTTKPEIPKQEPIEKKSGLQIRLLDMHTDELLKNRRILVYTGETGTGVLLGQGTTDDKGEVCIYIDESHAEGKEERELKISVLDERGRPVVLKKITVKLMEQKTQEFRIPVSRNINHSINTVIKKLNLRLDARTTAEFEKRKITTLADIRRLGGLEALGEAVPKEVAVHLQAMCDLSLICNEIDDCVFLNQIGFPNPIRIANTPKTEFIHKIQGQFDQEKAGEIHQMAQMSSSYLNTVLAGQLADSANNYQSLSPFMQGMDMPESPCQCRDCESAVSPMAYLADLLRYAMDQVVMNETKIEISQLMFFMHQPFDRLPASCEAVGKKVRQVRIAVEVLRQRLAMIPIAPEKQAQLQAAEKAHCLAVYQDLLLRMGTGLNEIRLAHRADSETRQSIADKLALDDVSRLDDLRLDPEDLTEQKIQTLFGLANTHPAAQDPLAALPTPEIEKWRMGFLRALWKKEDHPEAELPEGQPVIDPDVIGPDDMRWPFADNPLAISAPGFNPNRFYMLWHKRRQWVDNRLRALEQIPLAQIRDEAVPDMQAMLAAMLSPVVYENENQTPWRSLGTLDGLDVLHKKLSAGGPDIVNDTIQHLREDLALEADVFCRMMELKRKHHFWSMSSSDEKLTHEEWCEFRSILVQVQKQRFFEAWHTEEVGQNISLSDSAFWFSAQEPVAGAWPPLTLGQEPLIDPEKVNRKHLPEQKAGVRARKLWEERNNELACIADDLRNILPDYAAALRRAVGNADPNNTSEFILPHDPDELNAQLTSPDNQVVEAAEHNIERDFYMSIEDFSRLWVILAKYAQPDPAKKPTETEQKDYIRILTSAHKRKKKYSEWLRDEQNVSNPLPYWYARKAMLPPWRGGVEQRMKWQNALRLKGLAPIVDPDLINAGDMARPIANDPAFALWQARQEAIESKLAQIKNHRIANSLEDALLEIIHATSQELHALDQDEQNGYTIDAHLAQLRLSRPAFATLLAIINLLDKNETVLDSEWEEVDAILLQAWKESQFSQWREQEKNQDLMLSPEHFVIDRLAVRVLPKWRAKQDALRAWQDKLETRYDQAASIRQGIQKAVGDTEELTLPGLRDALIRAMDPGSNENLADILSKRFFISMRESGSHVTTRVSQAIVSIQGFLLALRMDQMQSMYPELKLEAPDFDEDWKWLGSYATWRAAMFVFLYPENLLYPTLRRNSTTEMKRVIAGLNNQAGSKVALEEVVTPYSDYLNDMAGLEAKAQCVVIIDRIESKRRLFIFGTNQKGIYWMAYDFDSQGSVITPSIASWAKASDFKGTILGVQPYYPPSYLDEGNNGYLYLFLRTPDNKIAFTRTAITPNLAAEDCSPAEWDELNDYDTSNWAYGDRGVLLEGPVDDNATFPNVPKLVVLLPLSLEAPIYMPENTNVVYTLSLNAAGTEWGSIQNKGKLNKVPYTMSLLSTNGAVKEEKYKNYEITAPFDGNIQFTLELPKFDAELGMGSRDYVGLYIKMGSGGATIDEDGHTDHVSLHPDNKQDPRSAELTLFGVKSGDQVSVSVYGLRKYHNVGNLDISFHLSAVAIRLSFEAFYLEDVMRTGDPSPSLKMITKLQESTSYEYRIWQKKDVDWEGLSLLITTTPAAYVRAICMQDQSIAVFWHINEASHSFLINKNLTQNIASGLSSVSGPIAMARKWNRDNLVVAKRLNTLAKAVLSGQTAYEWTLCFLGSPEGGWYYEEEHDLVIPAYLFPVAKRNSHRNLDASEIAARIAKQDFYADLRVRSPRWAAYADEACYYLPMLFGLQSQQAGYYLEALDCFRCVYDHTGPDAQRKIYPGLVFEETVASDFQRPEDWFEDPLNPHAIAATRTNAYTRYTILAIVRCLIEYADKEFSRDTVESLPLARRLYEEAEELLNSPELVQGSSVCDETMGQLEIDLGVLQGSSHAWRQRVSNRIADIRDKQKRRALVDEITKIANNSRKLPEKISQIWKVIEEYPAPDINTVAQIARKKQETIERLQKKILASDAVYTQAMKINQYHMAASGLQHYIPGFLTSSAFGFCIPRNPIADILRTKVRINLAKLRTGKNIAGVTRSVDPFAAPTDTQTGMPYMVGGQIALPGIAAAQPAQYRYITLKAKADQLLAHAERMEQALLSVLEKEDQETYNVLKARQDLDLAKAGIELQKIRVEEAAANIELAQLQKQSAKIRSDYYGGLLDEGWLLLENMALDMQITVAGMQEAMAAGYAAVSYWNPGALIDAAQMQIAALQTTAGVLATYASYERRRQEWEFQGRLAENDIAIGEQQIKIADLHYEIVGEEKRIAELGLQNAEDTVEFLNTKFGTAEMYRWMGNILRQIYAYFLQQAVSMAQTASHQLAFERHEPTPPFIQTDYWETTNQYQMANQTSADEKRQGILGAERLRQDLEKLDLYAFKTDERRLHLTRKISLAALSPWEFARFRQTGVLLFATPMELFDRDHPGHYLRLIHNVRVSVVGLIPPAAGIHATLTSDRISRVVIGGDLFQITQIAQGPNQIALSSPQEATGIFELDPQTDILRPFEGMGVDTVWEFCMPKASNQIDYHAIADVVVTLEYTALNSFAFKQQVMASLPPRFTADRAYSLKHNLPDQWYQFHNPGQSDTPMTVRFETKAEQFPPNLDNFSIAEITLYFASQPGTAFEIQVEQLLFKEHGQEAWIGGSATTVEKTISTRCSQGASWQPLKGKTPFGLWELALPNTADMQKLFSGEEITDILLVIAYQAYTPEWVK